MTYQEFKEAVVDAASRMKIKDYELYYTEGEGINAETPSREISLCRLWAFVLRTEGRRRR